MIPRTFLSTYAANGQQQMAVKFLTDITGLKRWADYIPVKLTQGGSENTYANNGFIDVVSVTVTSTMRPFAEYVPVYVDSSATDAWQVNATGYIPYGYAGFGGANMVLDFTNGSSLDSRITFTRASTATRVNPSGVIESVAINTARFDYNPATLAPLGLLIEEQRTNLITYSEQFDNAAWSTASPYSVTANTVISPDGSQDGDSLIVASGQSSFATGVTKQVVTKAASAIQYTRSAYFKALGSTTSVRFIDFGNTTTNSASVNISLVDGSTVTAPATTGTFSGASVSVTNAGNGWWRVALTYTTDTHTSLTVRSFPYVGSTALTGDGTSGLYIWGAQLEAGAFATSYIPTVASQVTRSSDLALMTGTNFSSWFNATEGTMYASYVLVSDSANIGVFEVDDNTSSNVIQMRYSSSSFAQYSVSVGGVTQASQAPSGYSTSGLYKRAIAYKVNSFNQAINGALPSTEDTSGTIPTVTQARIGNEAASNFINGYIRQIAYYPTRLTNAQLQSITA